LLHGCGRHVREVFLLSRFGDAACSYFGTFAIHNHPKSTRPALRIKIAKSPPSQLPSFFRLPAYRQP
jgi:hypothetical protein